MDPKLCKYDYKHHDQVFFKALRIVTPQSMFVYLLIIQITLTVVFKEYLLTKQVKVR